MTIERQAKKPDHVILIKKSGNGNFFNLDEGCLAQSFYYD